LQAVIRPHFPSDSAVVWWLRSSDLGEALNQVEIEIDEWLHWYEGKQDPIAAVFSA
jgi:hypothetical protein